MRIKKEHLRESTFAEVGNDARKHPSDVSGTTLNADSNVATSVLHVEVKKINANDDSSTKIFASSSLLTAGAGAGVSVSAISSPSALTIKDRLLEDLACARVAATDKTALFAMTDAKDMVLCSFSFALLLLSGCGSASANMPKPLKIFARKSLSKKKERECVVVCLFFCIFLLSHQKSNLSPPSLSLSLSLPVSTKVVFPKKEKNFSLSLSKKNKNERKKF